MDKDIEKETITARLDRNFAFELDLIKRVEARVAEKVWREAVDYVRNMRMCPEEADMMEEEGKRRKYIP